jgi:hypothetical protein
MEMGGTVEKANSRSPGASGRAGASCQELNVEREAEFREEGGSRKGKIALRAAGKVHWMKHYLVREEESSRAAAPLAQAAQGKGVSGAFRGLNGLRNEEASEDQPHACRPRMHEPPRRCSAACAVATRRASEY